MAAGLMCEGGDTGDIYRGSLTDATQANPENDDGLENQSRKLQGNFMEEVKQDGRVIIQWMSRRRRRPEIC